MATAKKHKAKALIADESDFKTWRLMSPNESKLLKKLVYRWRGSSIGVPGEDHCRHRSSGRQRELTIRQHLKVVLDKTGCERQADLARLLARLLPPAL